MPDPICTKCKHNKASHFADDKGVPGKCHAGYMSLSTAAMTWCKCKKYVAPVSR